MSRSPWTTAVALVAMLSGAGWTRTSATNSPSSSASPSVSGGALSVPSTGTLAPQSGPYAQSPSISPLLAQLNLARNFLVVAYKQLDLFLSLPPDGKQSWTGEVALNSADNSEDALPESNAPGLAFPVNAQVRDALGSIIGVAGITLDLVKENNFPQIPVIDQVKASLQSIILKATTLMNCQKAPCQ